MVEAPPRFVVPRKHHLPATTEPIWTLSEPMMKTYIGFAHGGQGLGPQPPCFLFIPCIACCQDMDPVRTRSAYVHLVCKWVAGSPLPTPRFLFVPCLTCCQEHRTVRKNSVSHISVEVFNFQIHHTGELLKFFKTHDTGILSANGGPGAPGFLKQRQLNSYIGFIWIAEEGACVRQMMNRNIHENC